MQQREGLSGGGCGGEDVRGTPAREPCRAPGAALYFPTIRRPTGAVGPADDDWVTLTGRPAIVNVAVRDDVPVYAVTL
jgi:hypothetical protein